MHVPFLVNALFWIVQLLSRSTNISNRYNLIEMYGIDPRWSETISEYASLHRTD